METATIITSSTSKQQLKKLTAALSELNEDRTIQKEYWDAIRSVDQQKLEYFSTMGENPRQQIMNVNTYREGLKFGFTEIIFDKYGWLKNDNWIEVEEVELRLPEDKANSCNNYTLAKAPNGYWTYGLSYSFGACAGGGFAPSVHDFAFESKESCIQNVYEDLEIRFREVIERYEEHPDRTNYNIPYINKFLKLIEEKLHGQTQLSLF